MRTLAATCLAWGFREYDRRWQLAARAGHSAVALDTRMFGWRYLSLNPLVLTAAELTKLARLTVQFGRLLDLATAGVLNDPAWWSELAWPWPAIELARQEPAWPHSSPYGRFDWLLEAATQTWQLVEYNADTPSGGRETSALEPAVWRLHGGRAACLRPAGRGLPRRLAATLDQRLRTWPGAPVRHVGIISSHTWLEDMAQAWWLAGLLRTRGWDALVGDVTDLSVNRGAVTLRGRRIEALYRFYPFERLYRHGVFGPLADAVLDKQLLLLNGLRGFLAQSKAVLAWLWAHRGERSLGRGARPLIEQHLPAVLPARDAAAPGLFPEAVLKHVNGREGDSVVFADSLDAAAWEARLLEGGYVIQRRVRPEPLEHVEVDELAGELRRVRPRYACVGSFCIGGAFGGAYSRLDGPITTGRAVFVPTLVEAIPAR